MSKVLERGFLSLFFPIYFERNVLLIVLLLDVIFLSSISSDAIAGVGIATPIVYTLVAMIGTISSALTGLMGQYIGSGRASEISNILKAGFLSGISLGIVLAAVQIVISLVIPSYIGVTSAAASACSEYLTYISPMLVTDGIFVVAASTINVHGKSRWLFSSSCILVTINTLINLSLYFKLIPGLVISPASIAISTVLSQIPSILIMLYCIFFVLKIRPWETFVESNAQSLIYKRLSKVFLPSLVNPVAANITQFIIVFFLAKKGTYEVAAFVFCRNLLIPITTAASSAFSISTQVFISHLQGKKKYAKAQYFLNKSLKLFLPLISFGMFLTAIFFPFIANVFSLEEKVADAGRKILFILIFAETARAARVSLDQSLRGSGYVMVPISIFVGSQCMIWIGCFIITIFMKQPTDLLLGMIAGIECIYALILFYVWNARLWISAVQGREI